MIRQDIMVNLDNQNIVVNLGNFRRQKKHIKQLSVNLQLNFRYLHLGKVQNIQVQKNKFKKQVQKIKFKKLSSKN